MILGAALMKPLQKQTFPCKTVLSLNTEYRMYGWFKTNHALRSTVEKARLNSSKDNLIVLIKETEHFSKLSLSICVFYWRIFNVEMKNFSLENHHMKNARQPFC